MILNYGKIIPKEKKKDDEKVSALAKGSLLKTLKLVEKQIMKILNGEAYYYYREWNKEKDIIDNKKTILNLTERNHKLAFSKQFLNIHICSSLKYTYMFFIKIYIYV